MGKKAKLPQMSRAYRQDASKTKMWSPTLTGVIVNGKTPLPKNRHKQHYTEMSGRQARAHVTDFRKQLPPMSSNIETKQRRETSGLFRVAGG